MSKLYKFARSSFWYSFFQNFRYTFYFFCFSAFFFFFLTFFGQKNVFQRKVKHNHCRCIKTHIILEHYTFHCCWTQFLTAPARQPHHTSHSYFATSTPTNKQQSNPFLQPLAPNVQLLNLSTTLIRLLYTTPRLPHLAEPTSPHHYLAIRTAMSWKVCCGMRATKSLWVE